MSSSLFLRGNIAEAAKNQTYFPTFFRHIFQSGKLKDKTMIQLTALTAKSREVPKPASKSTYEYQYKPECIL